MSTDVEAQGHALDRQETIESKPAITEDWSSLRRIPDNLPKVALLILAVEVRRLYFDCKFLNDYTYEITAW